MFFHSSTTEISTPRIYLARMLVFLMMVMIVVTILFFRVETAFSANPALNGLIILVLLFGIFHTFRQVVVLWPEVGWISSYRSLRGNIDNLMLDNPRLLGPIAVMLKNSHDTALSAPMLRTSLDSVGARLDESRDLSRYLIGLLIFLGLLGTFWGLLEAITAVGSTVNGLDPEIGGNVQLFEELRAGLEAPLGGMGKAFSSSLFGLSSSLVLGFLDLQATQAQNRFYNSIEDWLLVSGNMASGDGSMMLDDDTTNGLHQGIEALRKISVRSINETRATQESVSTIANIMQAQLEQNAAINSTLEGIRQHLATTGPQRDDQGH